MSESTRVAIACQGGGSHTAFTAGVLETVLPALAAGDRELVGISGTSGGAIAAVAGWYGHVVDGTDPGATLSGLWDDLVADDPASAWTNDCLVWGMRARNSGVPMPQLSPHQVPGSEFGKRQLRETLERHVDFERLADRAQRDTPHLVVGAVNVNEGSFETFHDDAVTAESVLASAAVPRLFEGVEIEGDHYWDGLFSQNPPVHELLSVAPERKPDELWVIQINPQQREQEPRSLDDIADRRNELAGNISLNQELRFVERMNDLLDAGHLPEASFNHVDIERVQFDRELSHASKLDRSPEFVADLRTAGRERGVAFLDSLR